MLSDLAPGDDKLTSTLEGFATNVRERVIVGVGQTVEFPVTLAIFRAGLVVEF